MRAVHLQDARSDNPGQAGACGDRHGVQNPVRAIGGVVDGAAELVGDVLDEGSAERDVEQLRSAADAQRGEPTRESGRLQRITVQCGKSEQRQISQLREPESRTEPTFEQPSDSAGNAPHGCSLSQPDELGERQIQWG